MATMIRIQPPTKTRVFHTAGLDATCLMQPIEWVAVHIHRKKTCLGAAQHIREPLDHKVYYSTQ